MSPSVSTNTYTPLLHSAARARRILSRPSSVVERVIRNHKVEGSIPPAGSTLIVSIFLWYFTIYLSTSHLHTPVFMPASHNLHVVTTHRPPSYTPQRIAISPLLDASRTPDTLLLTTETCITYICSLPTTHRLTVYLC